MSSQDSEPSHAIQQLNDNISGGSLYAASTSSTSHTTSPIPIVELVKEIQTLSDRTSTMKGLFERVGTGLGRFDTNGYKDRGGKQLENLQPVWTGFQQRFSDMIWNSRNTATDIAVVLREALCPILKDPAVSIQEKRNAIHVYIKGIKSTPQSQTKTFAALQKDIKLFSTKCTAFTDTQNGRLTSNINSLNGNILALTKSIDRFDAAVIKMNAVLVGCAIGAVVAGFDLASWAFSKRVAPVSSWALAITAAITFIGAANELMATLNAKSNASKEYQAKRMQVNNLNQMIQELQDLKTILITLDRGIEQTYARIDDFSYVWGMVIQDAHLLLEHISTSPEIDETIRSRIQPESVYKALISGLKSHATRVI
ncbi:hypothetical protein BDV93DRAFT_558686 [Ceratobasidium sp. AG-I]|nr:hypothetical protein BDV93DRAFT_558686 [Ceratobasidium sp. AG-I]